MLKSDEGEGLKGIESARRSMDSLNRELLELLGRRVELAREINRLKRAEGLPAYDPVREAEQIRSLGRYLDGRISPGGAGRIFKEIFRVCLDEVSELGGGGSRRDFQLEDLLPGARRPFIMAGPCAVETEEDLDLVARHLVEWGIPVLRGGAFKPRTSPFAFQGLGDEGLEILSRVAARHGLISVSEMTSISQLPAFHKHDIGIIQVGARNMYNYELLKALGDLKRPVLLKRHFAATVEEWLQAADYLLVRGNRRVILCERGSRTFEHETRNTLDLAAALLARARSGLPVLVDVSHALGRRDLIPGLARAAIAAGVDGLMVEVHPSPWEARSDGPQQLDLDQARELFREINEMIRR